MEAVIIAKIDIWEEFMENMIASTPTTTTIEHLRPFRVTGRMCPGDTMTGVRMGTTAEFQSTPESLASTQDFGQSKQSI